MLCCFFFGLGVAFRFSRGGGSTFRSGHIGVRVLRTACVLAGKSVFFCPFREFCVFRFTRIFGLAFFVLCVGVFIAVILLDRLYTAGEGIAVTEQLQTHDAAQTVFCREQLFINNGFNLVIGGLLAFFLQKPVGDDTAHFRKVMVACKRESPRRNVLCLQLAVTVKIYDHKRNSLVFYAKGERCADFKTCKLRYTVHEGIDCHILRLYTGQHVLVEANQVIEQI